MNLNSLIIVADASRARLFRTGQTNVVQAPVELIEVDAIEHRAAQAACRDADGAASARRASASNARQRLDEPAEDGDDDELRPFARQVAERAAHFARHHFCNPVVVAAPRAVAPALLGELEHGLPHAYVRPVIAGMAHLPPRELLEELQKRDVFTPVQYPGRG